MTSAWFMDSLPGILALLVALGGYFGARHIVKVAHAEPAAQPEIAPQPDIAVQPEIAAEPEIPGGGQTTSEPQVVVKPEDNASTEAGAVFGIGPMGEPVWFIRQNSLTGSMRFLSPQNPRVEGAHIFPERDVSWSPYEDFAAPDHLIPYRIRGVAEDIAGFRELRIQRAEGSAPDEELATLRRATEASMRLSRQIAEMLRAIEARGFGQREERDEAKERS